MTPAKPLVPRNDSLTVGNVTFRSMTSEERAAYRELLAGRLVKVATVAPERLAKLEAIVAAADEMRAEFRCTNSGSSCSAPRTRDDGYKCECRVCHYARAYDEARGKVGGNL